MSVAHLTRTVAFAAAHRYARDDWSPERNAEVFGVMARAHGHGHNYLLEATVAGEIHPDTGFSVDLGLLDTVLREEVVEPLHLRHLNHDVPAFGPGGMIPTTENIAAWAWDRIARRLPAGVTLHRVRVREDDTLHADYFGGGPPA